LVNILSNNLYSDLKGERTKEFHSLKEQINPINKPELNSTFQIQIVVVAISSVAQDLEKVETTIALKKAKLKNSKDVQEIDRLLAELEALEWLQSQIAVFSHRDNNEAVLGY